MFAFEHLGGSTRCLVPSLLLDFPTGRLIEGLSTTGVRHLVRLSGIPTDREIRFATSAIREQREPTILKIFRADLRPHADSACNPTDRETWFASSANQNHESPTILLIFASAFASLVASRVVQGIEAHRFKTSASKRTLQTFSGTSFGEIA